MTTIISDITEGSVRRDAQGWSAVRVFDVQSPGGATIQRPYNAVIAVETQAGAGYGEKHPVIPGIRVSSVSVDHIDRDPDVYRVVVEYRGDGEGSAPGLRGTGIKGIDVSTSTLRARSYKDYKGKTMMVLYQGPEVTIPGVRAGMWITEGTADQTIRTVFNSQPVETEFDLPTVTVTVTRERRWPSHVQSMKTATRVNSTPWSGLGAHKWLSLGIDSTLNDSGSYDWRYLFAVAPNAPENDTWRFRAAPEVVVYGIFRPKLTLGNGIEYFDIYPPANFQKMFGFTIPYVSR